MAGIVFIRKLKRPDGSGVWPAHVLDVDASGRWLFSPKGSLYRGQKAGHTGVCEVGQGSRPEGLPVLHLIPPGGWWIAAWAGDRPYPHLSIDICTPPTFAGDTWTYVDLEIDLLSDAPGDVRIEDEDEFDAARRAGIIPVEEARTARAAADEIAQLVRSLREPFAHEGPQRLARAIAAGLPPLRRLPSTTAVDR